MPKHIVRLIVLVAVFGTVAWAARYGLIADTFYEFGHYRGDSVIQVAAREPVYQTSRYCESCHADRVAQWSGQSHKTVACEVCHGAGKGHPQTARMHIPQDTASACALCHEAMPGRPRAQPQVVLASHTVGEPCTTCHDPHSPKITAAAAFVTANAEAGRKRAADCAGCHGAQGISDNETWPSLAGQNEAYLARIMAAYKSGAEKDVAMTPIARDLTDAEVQDLAAYYARLACGSGAKSPPVGDAAAGGRLAKNCASCHGEAGITKNPAWPSLAGQKPGYLVNAMKAFRAGLRKDPMMVGVARGLSDTDIANLAAFYAEQSCTPVQQARRTP